MAIKTDRRLDTSNLTILPASFPPTTPSSPPFKPCLELSPPSLGSPPSDLPRSLLGPSPLPAQPSSLSSFVPPLLLMSFHSYPPFSPDPLCHRLFPSYLDLTSHLFASALVPFRSSATCLLPIPRRRSRPFSTRTVSRARSTGLRSLIVRTSVDLTTGPRRTFYSFPFFWGGGFFGFGFVEEEEGESHGERKEREGTEAHPPSRTIFSHRYLRVSDDAGSQVKALNNQVLGGVSRGSLSLSFFFGKRRRKLTSRFLPPSSSSFLSASLTNQSSLLPQTHSPSINSTQLNRTQLSQRPLKISSVRSSLWLSPSDSLPLALPLPPSSSLSSLTPRPRFPAFLNAHSSPVRTDRTRLTTLRWTLGRKERWETICPSQRWSRTRTGSRSTSVRGGNGT